MKNSKPLIICALLGLCLLFAYTLVRQRDLKKIRAELTTVSKQRNDLFTADQEVTNLAARYGAGGDVPSFVEEMQRNAREVGLDDDYELSSNLGNIATRRPGGAGQKSAGTSLAVNRMKITLHGEYRDIAEYLRLLQEDKNPKKFIDFKMVQEKGVPGMNLTLELYSYRGGNGT